MRRLLVITTICLLVSPTLAADGDSTLPLLPEEAWLRLAPEDVEGHADFTRYRDVFAGMTDTWRQSMIYTSYGDITPLADLLTIDDIMKYLTYLRAQLQASGRFEDGNGPDIRSRLRRELDGLLSTVQGLAIVRSDTSWVFTRELVTTEFQPLTHTWIDVPDPEVEDGTVRLNSDSVYFPGRDSQVILKLNINRGESSLGGWQAFCYYASLEQAIEYRTITYHVRALFNALQQPRWQETAEKLADINLAWRNYLIQGYSQYPWESLLNSHVKDFTWNRPPGSQWVALHPEMGFLLDTRALSGASAQLGLLTHVVGHIWYMGQTNSGFLGLSATFSITGDSEFGGGWGVTIHGGHAAIAKKVPHVSVSILSQSYATGGKGLAIGLNVDLWRLVSDGGDDLFQTVLRNE